MVLTTIIVSISLVNPATASYNAQPCIVGILRDNVLDTYLLKNIIASYGLNPSDYVLENLQVLSESNEYYGEMVFYRPWYSPDYIVVVYDTVLNNTRSVIIWVYSTTMCFDKKYVESMLYIELGYLVMLDVVKPAAGKVSSIEDSLIIIQDPGKTKLLTPYQFISGREVLVRPKWEERVTQHAIFFNRQYIVTTPSPTPTWTLINTYGGESSGFYAGADNQSLTPTSASSENTVGTGFGGEAVVAYEALDKYYVILIAFLTALIASITVYVVVKRV